ncbi:uncharacterized protein LOC125291015 [Alosa alosa]|uniref:uncharacterized protein LOC125291015 n=1 Tax=Alosa alosa TaxID=278164 RepID=UPI00201523FA|nr:uncharacterized protein LOC125291015 [Alosa alosa]
MDIFMSHCVPEVILTDRGREFCNEINAAMFERYGVKHRMTSAYHPQTNGLDERTNQTLKRAIGKTLDGHQNRWEDNLKNIVFAHNSSVQSSSRFSPFRLMYGREPRLFSEITGETEETEYVDTADEDDVEAYVKERAERDAEAYVKERAERDVEAYVKGRAERDAEVFEKVHANLEKAQQRQKVAYRNRSKRGMKRFLIKPGMEVLKKDERKRGRPGMTMKPDWPTKYRVVEVEGNLVQLETMDGIP